jgi:hypothetical protein
LVLRTPGTFSQKMMEGRCSSIASAISQKVSERLPRSSSSERRKPATLNAWQGVPPHRMSGTSTAPERIRSGRRVMSPRFGTPG